MVTTYSDNDSRGATDEAGRFRAGWRAGGSSPSKALTPAPPAVCPTCGTHLRPRTPTRSDRLRRVVRYLLARDQMEHGAAALLAEHFKVSRQRVHQVVLEERARRVC